MTPKIAVIFNEDAGGPVLSIRQIINDSKAKLVDCDYKKICNSMAF